MAATRLDLPLPVAPTTAMIWPRFSWKVQPRMVGSSSPSAMGFQEKAASCISTMTSGSSGSGRGAVSISAARRKFSSRGSAAKVAAVFLMACGSMSSG